MLKGVKKKPRPNCRNNLAKKKQVEVLLWEPLNQVMAPFQLLLKSCQFKALLWAAQCGGSSTSFRSAHQNSSVSRPPKDTGEFFFFLKNANTRRRSRFAELGAELIKSSSWRDRHVDVSKSHQRGRRGAEGTSKCAGKQQRRRGVCKLKKNGCCCLRYPKTRRRLGPTRGHRRGSAPAVARQVSRSPSSPLLRERRRGKQQPRPAFALLTKRFLLYLVF